MTESTTLAERYRRLLAWYPRDHRERHGEEMLSVLLAGAGERTRPSRRETADLLRGALRLHLRRVVGADGGIDHRDVFAIVSLLGPVVLLAGAAPVLDWLAGYLRSGSPWSWARAFIGIPHALVWGIWFVVAVLSLARMRRAAAVGAWLGTAGFLFAPLPGYLMFWDSVVTDTGWMLLGAVVAAALTWSPGPARGWELVGGVRIVLLVGAVGTSVVLVLKSFDTYGLLSIPVERITVQRGASELVVWGLALAVLAAGAVGARQRADAGGTPGRAGALRAGPGERAHARAAEGLAPLGGGGGLLQRAPGGAPGIGRAAAPRVRAAGLTGSQAKAVAATRYHEERTASTPRWLRLGDRGFSIPDRSCAADHPAASDAGSRLIWSIVLPAASAAGSRCH